MRLRDLEEHRVALWGFGREGQAMLPVLRSVPAADVMIVDERKWTDDEKLAVDGVPVADGDGATAALEMCDVIIKSPGISLYRPEVEAARQRGAVVTSSTRLWFSEHVQIAEHDRETCVCVTGTKGKSTTSSLIAHLLREAGEVVELRGNIGRPLFDPLEVPPSVWVVELSSYQTADLALGLDVDPTVAVLLNLFPEHLDWHGDVETYYSDKLHLFAGQRRGTAVVNATNDECVRRTENVHLRAFFNDPSGFHVANGYVCRGGEPLVATADLALAGRHNHENVAAALAAVAALGHDAAALAPAAAAFEGLPHRLQMIGDHGGLLWVDDSISTTPQSAMAAINAFLDKVPITILLGGFERGLDVSKLASFVVEHGVHAVTMAASGPRIAEAIRRAGGKPEEVADLEEAVAAARRRTPSGGVVLLSPAAPSYGEFRSFEERGEAFARAVTESPFSTSRS